MKTETTDSKQTEQTGHTPWLEDCPLPWHADGGGGINFSEKDEDGNIIRVGSVGIVERRRYKAELAELIVNAVNSHSDLLEACKRLIEDSRFMRDEYSDMNIAVHEAEEAIAKAEGKQP